METFVPRSRFLPEVESAVPSAMGEASLKMPGLNCLRAKITKCPYTLSESLNLWSMRIAPSSESCITLGLATKFTLGKPPGTPSELVFSFGKGQRARSLAAVGSTQLLLRTPEELMQLEDCASAGVV